MKKEGIFLPSKRHFSALETALLCLGNGISTGEKGHLFGLLKALFRWFTGTKNRNNLCLKQL